MNERMKTLYWARMSDGRVCVREGHHTFDEYDTCLDEQTMRFMAYRAGVELVEEVCDWSPPKLVAAEDEA